MGRIEDVSRTDVKLKSALKRLQDSEILAVNKEQIYNFYVSLRRENLKKNTQASHINTLTETCKIYQSICVSKPLHETTLQEFDTFIFYLEDEKHYKPGTINVFKKSFKKFMKWHWGESTPQWVHRDIKLKKCDSMVQPQDLPTQEEFAAFLEEARHPRNEALIAVSADAGIRIGALLSCIVQSVHDARYGVILYLSRDGQNKTTPAKGIPLTWSSGYLQKWLAMHPLKNDPNAPLWTTLKSHSGKTEALTYDGAYQVFVQIEKRLNARNHIHPHTLRHYAVTTWILDKLPDQAINHRAGWRPTSKQMMNIYGNWKDEDMNNLVFEHYGMKTEDIRQVTLKQCPRCDNLLKPGDRFCSRCNMPLSMEALQRIETYESQLNQIIELFGQMASGQVSLDQIKGEVQKHIKKED